MLRKCASFAFVLALVFALAVTLGLAWAHPPKALDVSASFSSPYEPAPPVFKAANEAKVVSTTDWGFAVENAGTPAGVMGGSRLKAVSRANPPQALRAYAPLLQRPPPSVS